MIFTEARSSPLLSTQDKKALAITRRRPKWFGDDIWKYQRYLRKYEYYSNSGALLRKWFYRYLHKKKGMQLGFDIPIGVFGPALESIA
ncbi:serine acetyltransferase [Bacillus safensis FO-36b] [Bacillus safensis subsp. safensis]